MRRAAVASHVRNAGLLLASVFYLAGCDQPEGMRVSSAYGKGIKFDGIGSSYAWAPDSMQVGQQYRPESPEADAELTRVIEEELAKKGFHPASSGGPDFFIRDGVYLETRTDSSVIASGVTYEKGSLFIDVLEPVRGQLIWRGVVQAKLDPSMAPDERVRRTTVAIRALLKEFPAQTLKEP